MSNGRWLVAVMNQPVKFRAVLLIEGLASSGMTLGEASPGVPVAGGWEKMRTKLGACSEP